ncbi:hypothetical protein Q0L96_13580, partial [Staphylococcus aureus]|nr:hypothetical protein [Staphylococcus aureus]
MTLDPRLTADAIRYREAIERSFDALAQAILRLSPFLVERERAARQEHEAREMIAAAWPIDPAPVPSLPRVRHPKRVLAETDP